MINKASKVYGLTVKIIRREARYGLGVVQGGGWGLQGITTKRGNEHGER